MKGQRWSDLTAWAIRRNDPAFIADKVYDKLRKSGLSAGAANAAGAEVDGTWLVPAIQAGINCIAVRFRF